MLYTIDCRHSAFDMSLLFLLIHAKLYLYAFEPVIDAYSVVASRNSNS